MDGNKSKEVEKDDKIWHVPWLIDQFYETDILNALN